MKKLLNYLIITLITAIAMPILAQKKDDERPPRNDLPFEISETKRQSVKDLEKKKEGWYPTGLPLVNYDPNLGIGYGARVILFNNGAKSDPFFEYTPYRTRIFAQYFNTTKNYQYHWLSLDSPYVFNTKWRVRADAIYERNPNTLFFGVDENSMRGLSYHHRNNLNDPVTSNGNFHDYEESNSYRRKANSGEVKYHDNAVANSAILQSNPGLANTQVTDKKYNRYDIEIPKVNLSGEHSFFGGTVRTAAGVFMAKNKIRFFDGQVYNAKDPVWGDTDFDWANISVPTKQGKTKLKEACESGKVRGCDGGFTNIVRVGIVLDTRDFEPDPNKGVMAEITHERAEKGIGSDFQFNRTFAQGMFYYSPFPRVFDKLVIAGRGAFVTNRGDTPFFEYRNMWSTEGGIAGLGGLRVLRGYKQDRFVGPNMGFGSLEVRWKFVEIPGFAFNLVPFWDFGRVWDNTSDVNLKDYKYSYGLGLRIAWNQATIIMIDHAWSKEDRQTFVNFNHAF